MPHLQGLSLMNVKILQTGFLNHTNLNVFNITGGLKVIEKGAFNGLPKIAGLNFQKNEIITLQKGK